MYSSTKIFRYYEIADAECALIVEANGGQIDFQVRDSIKSDENPWITSDSFTTDGAWIMVPGRFDVRIVVTGSARFSIGRGRK